MQIEVAVNKTAKYASGDCGDSAEVVERPKGGISALLLTGREAAVLPSSSAAWLEGGRPGDDMTVLALGVHGDDECKIGRLRVTYPV
ncbi:MAG: hypothetical protein KGZ79_07210 [Dethiobacter sp.]|jgi:hypothetical protein|nr:hypothetical protein [Dethiobacter sp.]